MINVFVGFDQVEAGAFYPLLHSIHKRSSMPVSFTPVSLENLRGILTRERHPLQSNEFSFSRWLVPWMSNYEGWSIFIDCDMLFLDDIAKLWAQRDDRYAVQVVKHNHIPPEATKYLGATQTKYDRKNWSSVMLFNNAKCKALTPEYVNEATGLDLHQFKWLKDEEIGNIPNYWNILVGYDEYNPRPGNVHWTIGGPYFDEYRDMDYAREYFEERDSSQFVLQRADLEKDSA